MAHIQLFEPLKFDFKYCQNIYHPTSLLIEGSSETWRFFQNVQNLSGLQWIIALFKPTVLKDCTLLSSSKKYHCIRGPGWSPQMSSKFLENYWKMWWKIDFKVQMMLKHNTMWLAWEGDRYAYDFPFFFSPAFNANGNEVLGCSIFLKSCKRRNSTSEIVSSTGSHFLCMYFKSELVQRIFRMCSKLSVIEPRELEIELLHQRLWFRTACATYFLRMCSLIAIVGCRYTEAVYYRIICWISSISNLYFILHWEDISLEINGNEISSKWCSWGKFGCKNKMNERFKFPAFACNPQIFLQNCPFI